MAKLAEFTPGTTVESENPSDSALDVASSPDRPLGPGLHRFQLVVVDDSGNASLPSIVEVLVVDRQRPTAVVRGPGEVQLGAPFQLSGEGSRDVPPGRIARYVWTLLGG